MEKLRIFIALELDEKIKKKLALLQKELEESQAQVKWIKPENMHLTLKFLGYVTPLKLKKIIGFVQATAQRVKPFVLSFKKIGAFPSEKNPRVIWVGIERGRQELFNLQAFLEESFPEAQEKKYHPHVTLGRVKSSQNKQKLGEALLNLDKKTIFNETLKVAKITVMQSILKKQGPEYKVLRIVDF